MIPPAALASASAPPLEENQIPALVSPSAPPASFGATPGAPPMEQFDPPPKVKPSESPPSSPSLWSRLFGQSPPRSRLSEGEAQALPSAPPVASSSNEASSSAPSSDQTLPLHLQTVSPPPLRLSTVSTLPLSTESQKEESMVAKALPISDKLGISKAEHRTKRSKVAPIAMPPKLMPPASVLLNECQPKFLTEELCMPFIIPEHGLTAQFYAWIRTLWFTKMENAKFEGSVPMLCPAWRLQGSLTVEYHAVASVRTQQRDKITVERYKQHGSLRIDDYTAVFCGADRDIPFSELLYLCTMTDKLPTKNEPSLFQWILGSRAEPMALEEFPEPKGSHIDRSPDWYQAWKDHIKDMTDSRHPFSSLIATAIRDQPGLKSAEVTISSIAITGFHDLLLSPLRIPVYLCNYSLPSESNPYHLLVNGQNGQIHDGGKRPLTGLGGFMKFFFGGAFSK